MIPTLADALAARGFDTLTAVQTAVTAPELAEADLLVSAQTGSGKTVAFGLAIAPTLLGEAAAFGPAGAPLALVVAPTRELALQVQRELAWLFAGAGAEVASCIGGMDAREERRVLERGAHVVVGTPGRLCDHINRGSLDLSAIRAVVLDEADEMLDLGFREDLEFMLGAAPATRRTLLFSATVSPAIAELARTYQRDAVRVTTISRGSQHADIAYQVVQVAGGDAEHAIINLLRFHDAPTSIVFANTRAAVARLSARLANRGLSVVGLSGELSQDERSHALQALRDGRARVCVATDVAARGLDLPNLDLVIHADLPTNTETLLHRSGRTGRAGRKGISALIVTDRATAKATRLLKWAKIEAEWTVAPTPDEILARDEARLLGDAVWTDEPSETEAAFAAKLLAEHGPEQIAVACLRLYRGRLSAPEDLNADPTPRAERPPFGPSAWIELSVGQDRRAEARWLLPLLCRAGDIDRAAIGRIRVQVDTTLVEIAEAALPGLLARLSPGGVLEDDIRVRKLDGVPAETGGRGPRPDRPRRPRPEGGAPRPPRKPAGKAGPPPAAPRSPRAADRAAERAPEPAQPPQVRAPEPPPAPSPAPAPEAPRKPRAPKRDRDAGATGSFRRDRKGPPRATARAGDGRPSTARPGASDTSKRMDRPGPGKPRPGKPKPGPRGGGGPPRRKG